VPKDWLNVYSTIDLMGSNFRADARLEGPTIAVAANHESGVTVKPTLNRTWELGITPSYANLLEFHGFHSHGMYCGSDEGTEHNVFELVIDHVFRDTRLLD
jgi:hypothetical protein